jgi:hypothetical protein
MARRIHPDHHDHHGPPVHQDGDFERPKRSHIERLRPGDDATAAIARLYGEGRYHPYAKPHDRPRTDLAVPELLAPSHHEPAHYRQATRFERVSPAPSEQAPQFVDEKHGAAYDNDASGWPRGMGPESTRNSITARVVSDTTASANRSPL